MTEYEVKLNIGSNVQSNVEQGWESLDAARQWVKEFVHWYNHEHRHSALKFVTPAQRHSGEDARILARLARREQVYELQGSGILSAGQAMCATGSGSMRSC